MHVAVLHGPNLNRLGRRRPDRYGLRTLAELTDDINDTADRLGIKIEHTQSNHEGSLIDWLHERQDSLDAVIANPAGLTPYGKSLRDALADTGLPIAIVHIAQMYRHDGLETRDLFRDLAEVYVAGLGWRGYSMALERLHELLSGCPRP